MSANAHGATPYYFVPGPSRHPVMASIGLFFVILGAGQWINGAQWGAYSVAFGLAWWSIVLYQWFRDAVSESEGGLYGRKIDLSFRWSMSWFIFSEVMFFGAFFTALWWARVHSVPALGGFENSLNGLWDDVKQIYALIADLQANSEKLLEYLTEVQLEALLNASAETIATVMLVLSDEPLMFIHLAAFTSWLRMLPPQYIAEVVAEVRTEILVAFLLAMGLALPLGQLGRPSH